MKKEYNVIYDSYYLIKLYIADNNFIYFSQIIWLMYLFEAYCMNKYNINRLYTIDYKAGILGPMNDMLYYHFVRSSPLNLTIEQSILSESISDNKKEDLKYFYNIFKNYGSIGIRNLISSNYDGKNPYKLALSYEPFTIISKEKIKKWFEKYMYK